MPIDLRNRVGNHTPAAVTATRVRYAVEVVALVFAVWTYLRVGADVPTVGAATVDNTNTIQFTAAIANGRTLDVWFHGTQDPWLRYVPQAVVAAALPLGEVSLQEAASVVAWYVLVLEAVTFPVGAYLLARITATRAAATVTALLYAGLRLGGIPVNWAAYVRIEDLLFGVDKPFVVDAIHLFRDLVPPALYLVATPALLLGGVVAFRAAYAVERVRTQYLLPAVAGVAFGFSILNYPYLSRTLSPMGKTFVFGGFQYLALAPAWTVGALVAGALAADRDSRRWAVVAGLLLGVAGSIQLGQATYAAIAIAVLFAHHRAWRRLFVTAAVSMLVAAPTAAIVLRSPVSYADGATRVAATNPDIVPLAAVVLLVGAFTVATTRLFPVHERTFVGLVTGVWLGGAAIASVFWWWSSPTLVAAQPVAVLVAGVTLERVWRLASDATPAAVPALTAAQA